MRNELYSQGIDPDARRAMEQKAVEAIERDFLRLYHAPQDERPVWHGSKSDLMEMAYYVYVDGLVSDDEGQPVSLGKIVDEVCRKVNIKPPLNPSSMALRAMRRKGVKRRTVLERYARKLAAATRGTAAM